MLASLKNVYNYAYLTTMIGNMQRQELRLFLRFVTGGSVCIAPKIKIAFNNLSGLGRRPIAHTCDFLLVLPVSYINYEDLCSDFKAWRMDSV